MMGPAAMGLAQLKVPVVMIDQFTMVCKAGELYELQWCRRGETPVCPFGPHGDQPIYSTGILERALAAGYDVWVVMTRSHLERYDAWWSKQLPAGHILFPPTGEDVTLEDAEFEPWVKLAVGLQLPQYLLPEEMIESMSQSQVDRTAERWMRDRFKDAGAIREWLHRCAVNLASDMRHPAMP